MCTRFPLTPATVLTAWLFVPLAAAAVSAQPPAGRVITTLAEGVFVIEHPDLSGWVHGNTLVVAGAREALVVDSSFTSATAREDIAEITRRVTVPVRYLVNTHWHQDHTAGNVEYAAAFPGLAIVAHSATATMLANTSPTLPADIRRDAPSYRTSVEDRLASGKASNGEPLTAEQRTRLQKALADIATVMAQGAVYHQTMPTLTLEDRIALDLGGRRVEIVHPGRGNTSGDVVVYLPKERVLATGDLLVSPVPFTFDGYPTDWIRTLTTIRQWPADAIVPGHGAVMRDHTYLDRVVTLMQTVVDQVDAQLRANTEATLEQVTKGMDLAAQRAIFAGDDPQRGANFDSTIAGRLVTIVYYELKQR